MNMSQLGWWLTLIGALNWGLVGLGTLMGAGDWNVVKMVLGSMPTLESVVYVLVGLGGVMMLTNKK